MTKKLEFASPEWFDHLRSTIERMTRDAGPAMDGVQWSVCEVFTDAPERVAQGPDGRAAWHCRIRGSDVEFSLGEIEKADFKVVADYQSVLPFARKILGNDPEAEAEVNQQLMEAAIAGKIRIEGDREARPDALATLHDEMARVTA